jgi:AcrR family transcriptional regulator
MAKDCRVNRTRSAVLAGITDIVVDGAGIDQADSDISGERGQRKHLREHRLGDSAPSLGLKPLPDRPSTKALLMDVGEILMGCNGIEGVTLREIGLLAGQANSNVVQYHFESKEGLIAAILEDRVRRTEKIRSEQFQSLRRASSNISPRRLLEILWLPTLTFQDENGSHAFCRFMLQCRLHLKYSARYPHNERYDGSVIVEIMELLREYHQHLPKEIFNLRLSTLTLMFVSCVVEFDNGRQTNGHLDDFDPAPILDMAIAALAAQNGEHTKK